MTSRIGKIVSVTILRQEYPQMWRQIELVGLVVKEDRDNIVVLSNEKKVSISKKQIMEIVENS